MTEKIIVYEIENITPGARHYWLKTNIGRVRKPIGSLDLEKYDFTQMEEEKIVLVESRLLHWGKWLLKSIAGSLSYPSQSTLITALQGSPSTASKNLGLDNPDAEEVEAAVRKMEIDKKLWATVLRKHYTREDGETAKQVAKTMELPHQTYFHYLNGARKYVEKVLKNRC